MKEEEFKIVQNLVGPITPEEMKNVNPFYTENLGLFIPSTGPCYYAITPEHTHPSYSIVHSFDDRGLIEKEGKISRVDAGKLYVLSPKIPHREILQEKQPRYVAIMIDQKFFDHQLASYKTVPKIFKGEIFPSSKELVLYLKDFMMEYRNNLPGKEILLKALSIKICHTLIRLIYNHHSLGDEKLSARLDVDKGIEFFHENYKEKITVKELASFVGYSESYYTRIFKEDTGMSPMEYLMTIRLDKAKLLLNGDELNISQVAMECGFNSSSYFSRCFQEKLGLSPSEFKKLPTE